MIFKVLYFALGIETVDLGGRALSAKPVGQASHSHPQIHTATYSHTYKPIEEAIETEVQPAHILVSTAAPPFRRGVPGQGPAYVTHEAFSSISRSHSDDLKRQAIVLSAEGNTL